ncbi:hypothetical protein EYF80_026981 [Liparis tanakae]|uniref:Uncharacterized protein n=1 Tax=Liparis tanakae TaxID=230148 RepID=A0A4Z2HBV7_9TELE|nr:hypothetical protein EYF80_026981 [Liparis tanakae]
MEGLQDYEISFGLEEKDSKLRGFTLQKNSDIWWQTDIKAGGDRTRLTAGVRPMTKDPDLSGEGEKIAKRRERTERCVVRANQR